MIRFGTHILRTYISNYGLYRSVLFGLRHWPFPTIHVKLSHFIESKENLWKIVVKYFNWFWSYKMEIRVQYGVRWSKYLWWAKWNRPERNKNFLLSYDLSPLKVIGLLPNHLVEVLYSMNFIRSKNMSLGFWDFDSYESLFKNPAGIPIAILIKNINNDIVRLKL